MTTDERLTKLEERLTRGRWLNRCLLAALCLCLGAWALVEALRPRAAPTQPGEVGANVVRAREFILQDANGNIRAILGVSPHGPGLDLLDENGKTRAGLTVFEGDPMLSLNDQKNNSHATLAVTDGGPWLNLWNDDSKSLWSAP